MVSIPVDMVKNQASVIGAYAQPMTASKSKSKSKQCVDQIPLTAEQELTRFRKQFICECLSLTVIILAVIFCAVTPFLPIPIWVIPNEHSMLILHLLFISLGLSFVFLIIAAILGNVYWYYDEKKQKWRYFLHCGRGPRTHYWGDMIFTTDKEMQQHGRNCILRV